jgi:hypothetical protein
VERRNDVPAVILDIVVRRDSKQPSFAEESVLTGWFDEAHAAIRGIFQTILIGEVRSRMGAIREVKVS